VGIQIHDVRPHSKGLVVELRRSKTDQEGKGRSVPLPLGENVTTCPVRAVEAWLEAARLKDGPLFRPINRHGTIGDGPLCDRAVARVVKAAAERSGLDPRYFSGHSLRAGLTTQAALAGKTERDIMNQTGHVSVTQVRKYIRDAELFRSNAASGIGL
jgi:integrase